MLKSIRDQSRSILQISVETSDRIEGASLTFPRKFEANSSEGSRNPCNVQLLELNPGVPRNEGDAGVNATGIAINRDRSTSSLKAANRFAGSQDAALDSSREQRSAGEDSRHSLRMANSNRDEDARIEWCLDRGIKTEAEFEELAEADEASKKKRVRRKKAQAYPGASKPGQEHLTLADVARREGVAPSCVTKWIRSGQLRAMRGIGQCGSYRIRLEWLEEFRRSKEVAVERTEPVEIAPVDCRSKNVRAISRTPFQSLGDAMRAFRGGAK